MWHTEGKGVSQEVREAKLRKASFCMRYIQQLSAIGTFFPLFLQTRNLAALSPVVENNRSFQRSGINKGGGSQVLYLPSGYQRSRHILYADSKAGSSHKYSQTTNLKMPRGIKKENLPVKTCVTCGRPFTWRKKWERVWDEVTTCSKSCNRKRREAKQAEGKERYLGMKVFSEITETNDIQGNIVPSVFEGDGSGNDDNLTRSSVISGCSFFEDSTIFPDNDGNDVERTALLEKESIETSAGMAILGDDSVAQRKAQRKAETKAKKAERRAQRQGRGDPKSGQKTCDMCGKSVDLLIRCVYEEGQIDWKMVCGKCWKTASGGVVDGDSNHPHYRYGGLWKNRRAQK